VIEVDKEDTFVLWRIKYVRRAKVTKHIIFSMEYVKSLAKALADDVGSWWMWERGILGWRKEAVKGTCAGEIFHNDHIETAEDLGAGVQSWGVWRVALCEKSMGFFVVSESKLDQNNPG